MWGVMVAVLNFVPYLGALTGIICMTLGAVLSFDSLGLGAMIVVSVYMTIAVLEGNFITPNGARPIAHLQSGDHPDRARFLGMDVGHFGDDPGGPDPGESPSRFSAITSNRWLLLVNS